MNNYSMQHVEPNERHPDLRRLSEVAAPPVGTIMVVIRSAVNWAMQNGLPLDLCNEQWAYARVWDAETRVRKTED